MEKATKVQVTKELEKVPDFCAATVKDRALADIGIAQRELQHLLGVSEYDGNANVDSILWHVEQARQRLVAADASLADVYYIAASYKQYKNSPTSENTIGDMENLKEQLSKMSETLSETQESISDTEVPKDEK